MTSVKKKETNARERTDVTVTYLSQRPEPVRVNRGLVHENLLRPVVGGDEPEPLLRVEPLDLGGEREGRNRLVRDRKKVTRCCLCGDENPGKRKGPGSQEWCP